MNSIAKSLLAVVACALCAGTAVAQDGTLKKIKDSGAITIGHRDASIPFSYYDDNQKPIGYAMDLCMKIVDAVKAELKMPKLEVKYQLVTSANRIPLMANGTIDLECGSTTNNAARQKDVAFGLTTYVTEVRTAVKTKSGINSIAQLGSKTVATTTGTTSVQTLRKHQRAQKVSFKEVFGDRKSTRLNSSHTDISRMPSSA